MMKFKMINKQVKILFCFLQIGSFEKALSIMKLKASLVLTNIAVQPLQCSYQIN